jgi:mRNA interferase RelE/StbE
MTYRIEYHTDVVKIDIPKISPDVRERIKQVMYGKLTTDPQLFGKPLRKFLKGHRALRVGQYRIIFRVDKSQVKIFGIQPRSRAYQNILKQIERL